MRPRQNMKFAKSRFQYLGKRRCGGTELLGRMGAHEGNTKTRRAAGDRRVADRRHEKAELLKRRARRKRLFLVAYYNRDDCRLTANGDSVARKFRDEKRDILP